MYDLLRLTPNASRISDDATGESTGTSAFHSSQRPPDCGSHPASYPVRTRSYFWG